MESSRGEVEPLTDSLSTAGAWLRDNADHILQEQIELARIPAPSFEEDARARHVESRLGRLGVSSDRDEVGNLIVEIPGADANAPPVVVAAHLDTVFDSRTPIRIRRMGSRWVGPGISDNARGLAVTAAVLRSLLRAGTEPDHPILFVFTVGEEGNGDLRGVKHLFADDRLRGAAAFIAVDGSGLRRIIHRALGCRRFRITVLGPGGHSWTDWGRPNPATLIGTLIGSIRALPLPSEPRTTLTIARLGGGTSVNSIPAEAWLEIDLRSEDDAVLTRLESGLRDTIDRLDAGESVREALEIEVHGIGTRPAGRIHESHPLVRAAIEATQALGHQPQLVASSTDANIPLSLGIPAIALGAGGQSGDAHTENEWFENTDGAAGAIRLLEVLAATAGF